MLAHPLHVPLSRAGRPALRWSMRLTAGARPCCMLLSSLVSSVRSTSACTGHDVYALVYEAYSGGSPLLHALKHGRGLRHGNQRGWRCLWVTTLVLLCRPPRHGLRQRPFSAISLLSTTAGPAGHRTTRTIVSLNARQPHWARESSTSVPLADSVVPCPPVRPKAPSRATPQLTSRQIGDAPSRIIGFKASKTRCIRTRAQWDPAVPRGLTSVRGEAPAFKQLVCRCVGRGGNERAGTTGGALAI